MGEISKPRPLRANDDLTDFDCGEPALNDWLKQRAHRNHKQGYSRVFVVENNIGNIAGYTALSTTEIIRTSLVKRDQRNSPPKIPVILLGQLAVDKNDQGQGIAKSLLYFALHVALAAADKVGAFGIITHPLNQELETFYTAYGFEKLPNDPDGAMMLRMKDLMKEV